MSHQHAFDKAKNQVKKNDPSFNALLKRHGSIEFKPRLERTPFEVLVRAIAHQQLNGKAAESILGRLLEGFSEQGFPTPEQLLNLPESKFRSFGFSKSKVKSIKDIARHTISGIVPSKEEIQKLSNGEIVERLVQIYGVGRWTVEMLLIFHLGRLDVWPCDDFGVRKGYMIWKKKRSMPTAKDLRAVGEKWAPHQTVVSCYLWKEADLAKLAPAKSKPSKQTKKIKQKSAKQNRRKNLSP